MWNRTRQRRFFSQFCFKKKDYFMMHMLCAVGGRGSFSSICDLWVLICPLLHSLASARDKGRVNNFERVKLGRERGLVFLRSCCQARGVNTGWWIIYRSPLCEAVVSPASLIKPGLIVSLVGRRAFCVGESSRDESRRSEDGRSVIGVVGSCWMVCVRVCAL